MICDLEDLQRDISDFRIFLNKIFSKNKIQLLIKLNKILHLNLTCKFIKFLGYELTQ